MPNLIFRRMLAVNTQLKKRHLPVCCCLYVDYMMCMVMRVYLCDFCIRSHARFSYDRSIELSIEYGVSKLNFF